MRGLKEPVNRILTVGVLNRAHLNKTRKDASMARDPFPSRLHSRLLFPSLSLICPLRWNTPEPVSRTRRRTATRSALRLTKNYIHYQKRTSGFNPANLEATKLPICKFLAHLPSKVPPLEMLCVGQRLKVKDECAFDDDGSQCSSAEIERSWCHLQHVILASFLLATSPVVR